MRKLAGIIGCIFLIAYGCKKETTPASSTLYIDSQYHSFMFRENSYWVYKNASVNETDSLVLSHVESGFYWNPPPIHNTAGTRHEFYKMTIDSKSGNYQYIDVIDSYRVRRNPTTEWYICGRVIYSLYSQSNFEYLDSLSINGHIFYNVTKCKILANDYPEGCSNSGFDMDADLYVAPEFGVIRKIVHENQGDVTWDLIRWKIIK